MLGYPEGFAVLEFQIPWLQLLLVAAFRNLLGVVWYSPLLFGAAWARSTGCTQAEMRRRLLPMLPVEYFCSFVIAFVLAQVLNFGGAIDWKMGAFVGLLMALGFVAAGTPNQVMYARRPRGAWLVDAGFSVVSLMAMGVVMATWRWDGLIRTALRQGLARVAQ